MNINSPFFQSLNDTIRETGLTSDLTLDELAGVMLQDLQAGSFPNIDPATLVQIISDIVQTIITCTKNPAKASALLRGKGLLGTLYGKVIRTRIGNIVDSRLAGTAMPPEAKSTLADYLFNSAKIVEPGLLQAYMAG